LKQFIMPTSISQQRGTAKSRAIRLTLSLSVLVLAGCGGATLTMRPTLVITPGSAQMDTNCTGCNRATPSGGVLEQFFVHMSDGSTGEVKWSVTGKHAGAITQDGLYTPPNFITADAETVTVTATLLRDPTVTASAPVVITPGFFAPLTPQNIALAPGATANITGQLAEAGGSSALHFDLQQSDQGHTSADLGRISASRCQRGTLSATTCTVTYTAPSNLSAPRLVTLNATIGAAHADATILVNPAGITSSPVLHQTEQPAPVLLGTTGGNAQDYETSGAVISGCCGGTLGALVQDSTGAEYILSNNHILALSDQAQTGDAIVQPGLIDNDCSPVGVNQIATLTAFASLSHSHTNIDAAIAQVTSGAVDPSGKILEFGSKQADGTLSAAPLGVSSSLGRGETITAALLPLSLAKSGRTTGLTCGNLSVLNLDLSVDYFKDCAETVPYLTRIFTDQFAASGNGFGDAGDSGSVIVDASNAEPVGLYFAGGTDITGVSHAVANPAPEVLAELSAQLLTQTGEHKTLTFVGGADHPVSCLSYGDNTATAAQNRPLSAAQSARAQQALPQARPLIDPAAGVISVSAGKSNDQLGDAALLFTVAPNLTAQIPQSIGGVRTQLVLANEKPSQQKSALALNASVLNAATEIKKQVAAGLMKSHPEFFGVGVGQSLDNPREAALVIFVDRHRIPAELQTTIRGVRTRYIFMDRMHVTRSYSNAPAAPPRCSKSLN
jgi:hypothetical protein